LRDGAGALDAPEFLLEARDGLGPELGGAFDAADFRRAAD
jgi:dethiobiotin synthetase